jgi:hypothetical protein
MHYVDWYYTQHTCQKWNGFKATVLKLERFIKRHRANIPGPSNQKRVAHCVEPQRSGSINVHCALMQADFYTCAIHKWEKTDKKRRSSTAAIITDTVLHVSNHRRARNSLNFPLFENAARQRRVKAARTNAPSNFDWNISMSQLVDWVLVQRSRYAKYC